jgi:hypothetical protein
MCAQINNERVSRAVQLLRWMWLIASRDRQGLVIGVLVLSLLCKEACLFTGTVLQVLKDGYDAQPHFLQSFSYEADVLSRLK